MDQLYAEGSVRLGGGPIPDTNVHFYGATGDGAISSLYDRNTLIASNGNGVAPPAGLSLGAYANNGGSEASKGDVGEVLLYNRVLTPAEYASVVRPSQSRDLNLECVGTATVSSNPLTGRLSRQ